MTIKFKEKVVQIPYIKKEKIDLYRKVIKNKNLHAIIYQFVKLDVIFVRDNL